MPQNSRSRKLVEEGRPILVRGHIEIDGENSKSPTLVFSAKLRAVRMVWFSWHETVCWVVQLLSKCGKNIGCSALWRRQKRSLTSLHELFVVTYAFGKSAFGHPYSIMEFVDGKPAKAWAITSPSFQERFDVWQLYSRGLSYLYQRGELHGDPYLGNVIIRKNGGSKALSGIAIKIADAGTSTIWSARTGFARRESRLVYESANRLLGDLEMKKLIKSFPQIPPEGVIAIVNSFLEVVAYLGHRDIYYRPEFPSAVCALIFANPVYDLDQLLRLVAATPGIRLKSMISCINEKFDTSSRGNNAPSDALTATARAAYEAMRREFLVDSRRTPRAGGADQA